MNSSIKLLALVLAVLLTGCAAGPHTRVLSRMTGNDGKLEPLMVRTNLVGVVGFNEQHLSKANGYTNTVFYTHGIRRGSPEAQYRAVLVNTGLMSKTDALWVKSGERRWSTAVLVPDHIAELKAGDLVEYRSIDGEDSNISWLSGGDGQAVLRVLCRKSQPDFDQCVDGLPRWNGFKGMGHTGTPFPDSVQDYKFSFTKYYDENGKLLMPLPQ